MIDTWTDVCPTEGTCTCGLSFYWGEVLRPGLAAPRWCVEHRTGSLAIVRGTLLTLGCSFAPKFFWRCLRMHHPVRRRRLMAYLGILLIIGLSMFAAHQALMAMLVRWKLGEYVVESRVEYVRSLEQRAAVQMGVSPDRLPAQTRAQCQTQATQDCRMQWSYGAAVLEAVFRPLATRSNGRCTIEGNTYAYPAPVDLHALAYSRDSLGQRGVVTGPSKPFQLPWGFMLHFQLVWLVAIPLGFVLLPISRRRARVRWVHIIRIATYSLAIPVLIAFFTIIAATIGYGWPPVYSLPHTWTQMAHSIVLIPACCFWWFFAIRDYLKMPHAEWIAFAFGALGCLAYLLYRLASDNMGFAEELLQRGWTEAPGTA